MLISSHTGMNSLSCMKSFRASQMKAAFDCVIGTTHFWLLPYRRWLNFDGLEQPCPTQIAYWAKTYITILTRAAHWIT